jgi:hypothetical protein
MRFLFCVVAHYKVRQTKGILKENIMASLAEIRAKLQEQNSRTQSGGQTGGDNAIFPHWNIAEGQEVTVRFIPDSDPNNTFFWAERAMIKLPFAGIKGQTDSRPVTVQVPCMEMWGETCPILTEVRPWFKDKSLEDMGRKYWKKKSYVFQGFVVDAGKFKEDRTPENPIRRFIIGPQIFNIIKAALMDNEIEEMPTDYVRGLDFKIVKTTKGGYADYSTSKWSRRESSITQEQQDAVKANGLFNLRDFLPKKPTDVELKVIKEMFEASVDGEAFDMDRWSQYYKPAGVTGGGRGGDAEADVGAVDVATPVAVAQPAVRTESVAQTTAPAQEAGKSPSSERAQDILAAIRARQNKSE